MRTILALFAGTTMLAMSACSDDSPNDIPRTVPPASTDGAASAPVVKGVGPTIEATAISVVLG